jgi:hypothetical protein
MIDLIIVFRHSRRPSQHGGAQPEDVGEYQKLDCMAIQNPILHHKEKQRGVSQKMAGSLTAEKVERGKPSCPFWAEMIDSSRKWRITETHLPT